METTFWSYIAQNRSQILTWLVLCVGIFLSVLHRRVNPKKSILTLIAFVIFLFQSIGSAFLSFVWSLDFDSMVQRALFYEAFSWMMAALWIIAWTVLFFALFGREAGSGKVA